MSQSIRSNKQAYKQIQLPKLSPVPTMITDDEKQYLYWIARDVVSGSGAIVEIGTWFGCSAGYLGAGLRDANKEIPFYCFDRFELQGIEKRKARQQGFDHVEELEIEADIMPITADHLRTIYPIHLCKTYIENITWNKTVWFPSSHKAMADKRSYFRSDHPEQSERRVEGHERFLETGFVGLLHLDAPKRESDILHVLKIFVPYLMPGKSILVLQDFGMPRAYALPLIFGSLSKYFELVDMPSDKSTMAVFVYKKELNFPYGSTCPNGLLTTNGKKQIQNTNQTKKTPFVVSRSETPCRTIRWKDLYVNSWPPEYAQQIWESMALHYDNPAQKAFFNFGLALYFFRKGEKELAVKIAKENAPYVSSEQAELLDKRLCSRLWKLAFK